MKLTREQVEEGVTLIRSMNVDPGSNRERMATLSKLIDTLMPNMDKAVRSDLYRTIERFVLVGHSDRAVRLWNDIAITYDSAHWLISKIFLSVARGAAYLLLATGIVGGIVYLIRSCG
jgi:hypothetical protein